MAGLDIVQTLLNDSRQSRHWNGQPRRAAIRSRQPPRRARFSSRIRLPQQTIYSRPEPPRSPGERRVHYAARLRATAPHPAGARSCSSSTIGILSSSTPPLVTTSSKSSKNATLDERPSSPAIPFDKKHELIGDPTYARPSERHPISQPGRGPQRVLTFLRFGPGKQNV
jgi:hypothetical protein